VSRDERLEWIARHLVGTHVNYSSNDDVPGVEPREIRAALRELIELRAEKARNWQPKPSLRARFVRWFWDGCE
jgi:hypothetical protein